jgi:drug/metabolite transporter (DMT)-like permease
MTQRRVAQKERRVNHVAGVLIAIASSSVGGTAAAVTRYLVLGADPITLAVLRWDIGLLLVLPAALLLRAKWPPRRDWPGVAALGIGFFGLFFVLMNTALDYTTTARATLALSTLPLQTMLVGAALGIEPLTRRKSLGVVIAMLGVGVALMTGLAAAPAGAWRGEAIMVGAVLCMALYNVWSRPFIARSSVLGFLCFGMAAGAVALTLAGALTNHLAVLARFTAAQWTAAAYLGIAGGALAFILWVAALERATPTLVANTITVNPIAAALLATQLLDEPITLNLVAGLITVGAGLWIATTGGATARAGTAINELRSWDDRALRDVGLDRTQLERVMGAQPQAPSPDGRRGRG